MSQVIHCQQCGRYGTVSAGVPARCPTCGSRRVRSTVVADHTTPHSPEPIGSGRFRRVWQYLAGAVGLNIVGLFIAANSYDPIWMTLSGVMIVAGSASGIAAGVFGLSIVWRAWSVLRHADPDAVRRAGVISPGTAVGLLFVPVFQLYWIYRVFYQWGTIAEQVMKSKLVIGSPPRREPGQVFAVSSSLFSVGWVIMLAGLAEGPRGHGEAVMAIGSLLYLPSGLAMTIAYLATLREMERTSELMANTAVVPALAASA